MFQSRAQFEVVFAAALAQLAAAEKVTKATLSAMSRDLLTALHAPDVDGSPRGDISFINQTLAVLTPMNRRTAVLFFKEFSGFHYEERDPKSGLGSDTFVKKDKKGYAACEERSTASLADPHFNIWTWADKHVKVEAVPYDLDKVSKAIVKALKETKGDQVGVLRAVFKGGITAEALLIFMDVLTQEGAAPVPDAEQEQPKVDEPVAEQQ